MTLVDTARALVVVLGRRPGLDGAALVREAHAAGMNLRLLSVGYPVTPEQRAVHEAALAEADALGANLDIRLVLSRRALQDGLEPGTAPRIAAGPREAHRLEQALRGT